MQCDPRETKRLRARPVRTCDLTFLPGSALKDRGSPMKSGLTPPHHLIPYRAQYGRIWPCWQSPTSRGPSAARSSRRRGYLPGQKVALVGRLRQDHLLRIRPRPKLRPVRFGSGCQVSYPDRKATGELANPVSGDTTASATPWKPKCARSKRAWWFLPGPELRSLARYGRLQTRRTRRTAPGGRPYPHGPIMASPTRT